MKPVNLTIEERACLTALIKHIRKLSTDELESTWTWEQLQTAQKKLVYPNADEIAAGAA